MSILSSYFLLLFIFIFFIFLHVLLSLSLFNPCFPSLGMHKKSIEAAMKMKEQETTGLRLSDEDEPDDNSGTTTTTTTTMNNMNNNTSNNSRSSSADCITTTSNLINGKDLRTESIASLRAKAQCYNTAKVKVREDRDRQRNTSGDSAKDSDGSDVTDRFESCFEIPMADRKKNGRDVIELDNDVI